MNILKLSTDMQSELVRDLSPESTAANMLAKIVEQTSKILEASACTIFIIDPQGKSATQYAGTGYQSKFVNVGRVPVIPAHEVLENPAKEDVMGLTSWILSTGRSFLAQTPDELRDHPHYSGKHDPEQLPGKKLQLQTFLGVALRGIRGEVIGLIKAERRVEDDKVIEPFSISDQITIETVARVASKCLMYLKIAQEDSSDEAIIARVRWAREVITEATTTEGELDSFLDIVVKVVAATMQADSCAIYLIDERKNTLTQRAGVGFQAPRDVIRSYLLPSQEQIEASDEPVGLTAWIAATGDSHYAPNFESLSEHPHHRGKYDRVNFPGETRTECGAFLGVPLKVGGTIIGVLKVENIAKCSELDTRDFSKESQRRANVLSQDIALAIVRFQQQSRARYKVISDAQPTIFDILRGGLDVRALVKRVVEETAKLFNARACALFLKEGDRLIQPPWAAYGWAAKGPEVREYRLVEPATIARNPKPDEKVGLTVWIAVMREKFTAWSNLELTQHPHHKGTFDEHNFEAYERCESFMGVPLLVGDRLVGVLKVETKMKQIGSEQEEFTYFSEQDELVFDLIANSAAIAIENAKLLESQRLAEQIDSATQQLLPDLHKFVQNNLHAADTLRQAADLLSGRTPRVAHIIDHYAALLQPDFSIQHLEAIQELIGQYGDFLKESHPASVLYQAYLNALKADTLPRLSKCCASSDALTDAQLLESKFYLVDSASILLGIYRNIAMLIKSGQTNISRVSREWILVYLKEQQEKLDQLSQPEQNILRRIIEQWLDIVENAPEEFIDLPNPYIPGPPVRPEAGTPFFGRQDVFEWVAENLHGEFQENTLILFGERRMGKTSILLQLEKGNLGKPLRERKLLPLCPVFIDLQAIQNPMTHTVLHYIAKKVSSHPQIDERIILPSLDHFKNNPLAFNDFMTDISKLMKDALVVLMIDEFELLINWVTREDVSSDIYGQLRHQMQHLPNVAFILAGSRQIENAPAEYSNTILNIALPKEVSFLDEPNARDLIEKPVAGKVIYRKEAVDELLLLTHCHPYLLQLLCHHLIDEMKQAKKENCISLDHVQATVNHFIKQGIPHFSSIWSGLDQVERKTLNALVDLTMHGQNSIPLSLLETNLEYSSSEITQALTRLGRHQLVEEVRLHRPASNTKEVAYRPTMPLFSIWLQQQKQLHPTLNEV